MEQFSLEEKIQLLTGEGPWHTREIKEKLPSIMMTDGPHGLRKQEDSATNNDSKPATCFPTASAIACSWDPNLAKKMAEAIGNEALAEQVSIVLGCGINLKRTPLCGRNFEYFSEDPYLTGTLATSYIKTMESMGVATSLKHFAANNQECRRMTSNSQIDERALHELYLSAFEMVVKEAKPSTVMVSYNLLNGTHATENRELLTGILRNTWGYQGVTISDWGACLNLTKCVKAGLDLEMPDTHGVHSHQLMQDYQKGEISEVEIGAAAKRIISLVTSQQTKLKNQTYDPKDHHKIAREIECGCLYY